jgi:hypothetical protein
MCTTINAHAKNKRFPPDSIYDSEGWAPMFKRLNVAWKSSRVKETTLIGQPKILSVFGNGYFWKPGINIPHPKEVIDGGGVQKGSDGMLEDWNTVIEQYAANRQSVRVLDGAMHAIALIPCGTVYDAADALAESNQAKAERTGTNDWCYRLAIGRHTYLYTEVAGMVWVHRDDVIGWQSKGRDMYGGTDGDPVNRFFGHDVATVGQWLDPDEYKRLIAHGRAILLEHVKNIVTHQ